MVNIIYYFVVKEENILETRTDSSKRKKRIDVACFIWYTSTGRAIPKMIKYKDEKGTLRVMTNIQVILVEEKNYCGIPSTEFECEGEEADQVKSFQLFFFPETCQWKLLWK